jgi:hypothetical protein
MFTGNTAIMPQDTAAGKCHLRNVPARNRHMICSIFVYKDDKVYYDYGTTAMVMLESAPERSV